MKKLTMLSAIAMETFSNLSVMLEDINERASIVANRTDSAVKKLVEVEKGMRRLELQPESNVISYSQKYFKKRQVTIPPLFIKASNYSAVKAQYKLCREPPQLWRLENIVGDDLFQFFSFPGYFFQEWLRAELFKQERAKLLRRANKALKKLQKKEKKRKLMESQKIRTKSFIGRPTSMKLLDKTSPRPSQLGAGSVASADQALAPPVSVKTHFTSIAADDAKNAAAPGRPVSTAAAKLFADSPEPEADDAGATATAAEAPQKKRKGGMQKVFGLFRKDKDAAPGASVPAALAAPGASDKPRAAPAVSDDAVAQANAQWDTASLASHTAAATRPTTVTIQLPHGRPAQQTPEPSVDGLHVSAVTATSPLSVGEAAEAPHTSLLAPRRDDLDAPELLASSSSAAAAAKRRRQQQQLVANKYASRFQAKPSDFADAAGADDHRPVSILPTKRQHSPLSALVAPPAPPPKGGSDRDAAADVESSSSAQPAAIARPVTAARKRSSVLFAASVVAPKRRGSDDDAADRDAFAGDAAAAAQPNAEEALLQSLLGADYRTVPRDELAALEVDAAPRGRSLSAASSTRRLSQRASRPTPPPPPAAQQPPSQPAQPPAPQPQQRGPPPPPPVKQLKSALGNTVLDSIRSGAPALRKVDPAEVMKAKTPDLRSNILQSIKAGQQLRHVSAQDRVKVTAARQNEAIQRLLANRRDIAGSESDDSDGSDDESQFSF
eukprot:gene11915-8501_t